MKTLDIDRDIPANPTANVFWSCVSYASWKIFTLHCLDVLRDLVQEEDLERMVGLCQRRLCGCKLNSGWSHLSCWRQTFLEEIHTTLGLPVLEDSIIVAQALSQSKSSQVFKTTTGLTLKLDYKFQVVYDRCKCTWNEILKMGLSCLPVRPNFSVRPSFISSIESQIKQP